MKSIAWFVLLVSIGVNATLAVLLLMDRFATGAPTAAAPVAPANAVTPERTIAPDAWARIEASGGVSNLATRLEAEGFPPAMVQAILAAHIRELFQARAKALNAGGGDTPFWMNRSRDPKVQLALRQLQREQHQMLRDALGREPDESSSQALYQHKNLTFLAPEKASDVRRLLRDYEERRSDLYAAGYNAATDAPKMKALDKEHQDALAAVLTSTELLEYNLRFSRTAQTLREELSAFAPTEQEFRAIYALRAPFDERFTVDGPMLMTAGNERASAQRDMNARIKASLEPERAADFEKKTDYNYRRASQLIARLELPADTADKLWTIQKEVENQRRELYATRPSSTEVTEKMTALQTAAVARVAPLIGERNLETYYAYGGSWLQSLVPRPRPAPPGR